MTTQPQALASNWFSGIKFSRKRFLGLLLIMIGILTYWRASTTLNYDVDSVLTLETIQTTLANTPHIRIPTRNFLEFATLIFIVGGVLGFVESERNQAYINLLMILSGLLIIPTVLIAGAAGGDTNLTVIIAASFRLSTPIAIGAMAGLWCERAGVVNIAIEGMMLFAACIGFTTLFFLRDVFPENIKMVQFIAVIAAVLTGGVVALLHGWLSITFRTDQIVSGTVINILAIGVTSFIRREYLQSSEGGLLVLPTIKVPGLSEIPILGEVFFNRQPIFYMMFVILIGTYIMLYYTRWGLRMRAVGEHPHAADTLGINVNRTRWISVFIGGLIAGLAGAWFSLETSGRFNDNMTDGKGFIALAALIFGKWSPPGVFAGALLFGFSDALGLRFQIDDVDVPVQFLQMVPYLVTIIVLAGLIGRSNPPKASGQPYVKE